MRADNRGEGAFSRCWPPAARPRRAVMCGLFVAALLYGDGVIRRHLRLAPRGLELVAPGFAPDVVPLPGAILTLCSWLKRGTTRRARCSVPPLLWFIAISVLGPRRFCGAQGCPAGNPGTPPASCRGSAHSLHSARGRRPRRYRREALYPTWGFWAPADPRRMVCRRVPALLLNYFGRARWS